MSASPILPSSQVEDAMAGAEPPAYAALSIRPARPADAATIANLVYELAVYEKLEPFARATPDDFRHHLFGPRPYAEAIVAEIDGEPVGFALFFPTFSSFRGQPGLYLEDVYVRPVHRGRGIGKALLAKLAKLAMDRGLGRLEWAVLNWNSPAIGFYRSLARGRWRTGRSIGSTTAHLPSWPHWHRPSEPHDPCLDWSGFQE